MAKTTITITLTQDAQKAALLAGRDASRVQTYTISPEWLYPRLLALPWARIQDDGTVTCVVPERVPYSSGALEPSWRSSVYQGGSVEIAATERPADAEAAIAYAERAVASARAYLKARAEQEAAEQAQREQEDRALAESWAALPLSHRARAEGVARCRPFGSTADGPLATSGTQVVARETLERYVPEAYAEAQAEVERLRAEAEAAQEAAKAAALAEVKAWVEVHGSERLRKLTDLGYLESSLSLYRDERLAQERPGWEWESDDAQVSGVRCPELSELEALEEARRLYPAPAGSDAEVKLEYLYDPCSHGDHLGQEERDCASTREGRALRSEFLGYVICRWLQEV